MLPHGRAAAQHKVCQRVLLQIAIGLPLVWLGWSIPAQAQPTPAWDWQRDATLHDVVFAGSEHGWAVGDRGVIWHTRDGGQSWQPQQSNVACTLWSVSFADATTGWVVGCEPAAWGAPAPSVILRTFDGGAHWDVDRSLPLAGLCGVRLFSPRDACVWGASCGATPGGVLWTSDAGRSWQALSGDAPDCDWRQGGFLNPATGVLVSHQRRLYRVQAGQASAVAQTALRQVRAVRLAPAGGVGWAVGDGSLALCTHDGGRTWSPPPTVLPAGLNFDALAVATRGPQCWIAGDPGAVVWHSSDGGQSWSAQPTGLATPLAALTFHDEQHGVAVGALGSILATHDGGASWKVVQQGGRRAALLAVYARLDDVPWEVLAQWCAAEGYLAYVHVVGHADEGSRSGHALRAAREAALACGATGLGQSWKFPLPPRAVWLSPAEVSARWDALHAGRAQPTLDFELARCLRVWRPDVVLTHAIDLAGDDGPATLVREAVLRAAELASDGGFSEHSAADGLPPPNCSIYGCGPADAVSSQCLASSQIVTNLGRSLIAYTTFSRAWQDETSLPPAAWVFPQYRETTPDGERPFLQALQSPSGGDARRVFRVQDEAQQQAQLREARAWQAAAAALTHEPGADVQPVAHLAQLDDALAPLGPDGAATLLQQLAWQARRDGQWDVEAELLRALCSRCAQHPAAAAAARRLLTLQISAELALARRRAGAQTAVQAGGTDAPAPSAPLQRPVELAFEPTTDRWQIAALAAEQLRAVHPLWWSEPDVQLALAEWARANEQPQRAEQIWEQLVLRRRDAFARCAATERWLTKGAGACPQEHVAAVRVGRPPRLDGALDEPFWEEASPVALHSQDAAAIGATTLQFAWDERFFYLAATCAWTGPAGEAAAPEGPRERDASLETHDRLELWLDVDRDRSTAFRLTIDAHGWTHDACDGSSRWNPTWFVAQSQTPETWTIEAAVPLEELTPALEPGAGWAVGLTRIVPQTGVASWPRGLPTPPPGAEFGLLRFEPQDAP